MEQQLAQVLDKLAAKLGVAVDVLWAALMRQAHIAGVVDIIIIIAYAIGLYWTIRYGNTVVRKVQEHEWDEIAWLPFGFVAVVMFGIGIAVLAGLPMTAASFFNPEYWALQKILHR